MTLPLQGRATSARGLTASSETRVLRLRTAATGEELGPADATLAFTTSDLDAAAASRSPTAVFVGDAPIEMLPGENALPQLVTLPSQFSYLANGDVIALQPHSLRFRSLYRRNSQHNSLLVTERCNHYCLMCSQPPKDIDDRWLYQRD